MNELIKITHKDGRDTVSARELYDFLELDRSNYSRWVKKNIEEDLYFRKGVDWEGFVIMTNGNETTEYAITLDMAKELTMLARNDKGKQARIYFIEVEKVAKEMFPKVTRITGAYVNAMLKVREWGEITNLQFQRMIGAPYIGQQETWDPPVSNKVNRQVHAVARKAMQKVAREQADEKKQGKLL